VIYLRLQMSETVKLHMMEGSLTWTAQSEHQEVWAGHSWSSFALNFMMRSLLQAGSQDLPKPD
jgi:hypothetical protein